MGLIWYVKERKETRKTPLSFRLGYDASSKTGDIEQILRA